MGTQIVFSPDARLEIRIQQSTELPSRTAAAPTEGTSMRVLPTMSVRTFRLKVAKTFKIPRASQAALGLWLRMPDGNLAEIDGALDDRDLDWWGIEDGSEIILYVSNG